MKITFEAKPSKIGQRQVIVIPLSSSEKLPSRGMVMVEVSNKLIKEVKVELDENTEIMIEPIKEWAEPKIPNDIMDDIHRASLMEEWNSITIKARWDWFRWIRGTDNVETRKKELT